MTEVKDEIEPILLPIHQESYSLAKSNKRERSPTLANIESTPKYNKEKEDNIQEIINFEGIYHKYMKIINNDKIETYRIRQCKSSLNFVCESIKYSFDIKSPRCYLLEFNRGKTIKKYLGYEVYRDPKDNKIWEETPFDHYPKEKWTEKFLSQLKSIYFFRYLMGFKTTSLSLRIGYDGKEYFPISYTESIQAKGDNRSGKDFQITTTKINKDEMDAFNDKIFIDPNTELKKLCKCSKPRITRKDIVKFLDKLRDVIRDADPSYLWLVNTINLKISGILEV